jgi:hypothetical protein
VTPLQALSFLRTYLFDAKSAANTTEQRKIAKRNKSYMLAFANECDPIFEYLDFTPFEAESSDVDVSFSSCCAEYYGTIDVAMASKQETGICTNAPSFADI